MNTLNQHIFTAIFGDTELAAAREVHVPQPGDIYQLRLDNKGSFITSGKEFNNPQPEEGEQRITVVLIKPWEEDMFLVLPTNGSNKSKEIGELRISNLELEGPLWRMRGAINLKLAFTLNTSVLSRGLWDRDLSLSPTELSALEGAYQAFNKCTNLEELPSEINGVKLEWGSEAPTCQSQLLKDIQPICGLDMSIMFIPENVRDEFLDHPEKRRKIMRKYA